jgi:hypothetical protein
MHDVVLWNADNRRSQLSQYVGEQTEPSATLFEALRYEQLFYFYMGGTLILGLYLAA